MAREERGEARGPTAQGGRVEGRRRGGVGQALQGGGGAAAGDGRGRGCTYEN
jgi:hypothetical protein